MKLLLLFAAFCAVAITASASNDPTCRPYYDLWAHISLEEEVDRNTLAPYPYSARVVLQNRIDYFPEQIAQFDGISMGFVVFISVDEIPRVAEKIEFTDFSFSLFRVGADGEKKPVVFDSGDPIVDMTVSEYGLSGGFYPKVSPYLESWFSQESPQIVNRTGGPIVGSTLESVRGFLVEKHTLPWYFCQDFTPPAMGERYEIDWKITFRTTWDGQTFPEDSLFEYVFRTGPPEYRSDFTLAATDVSISETGSRMDTENNKLIVRTPHYEYLSLEYSNDLETWHSVEGNPSDLVSYTGNNTTVWNLTEFDSSQLFHRLKLNPQKQFRKFQVYDESISYVRDNGILEVVSPSHEYSVRPLEEDSDGNWLDDTVTIRATIPIAAIGGEDVFFSKEVDQFLVDVRFIRSDYSVYPPIRTTFDDLHVVSSFEFVGSTLQDDGDFWVIPGGTSAEFHVVVTVTSEDSLTFTPGYIFISADIAYLLDPTSEKYFSQLGFGEQFRLEE